MKDKEKEKGEVSRRDFLVGTGAIVGGVVGAGMLAGCGGATETVTTTKTVSVPTTITKTVGDGATTTVTDTVTTTVGGGGVPSALEPEETFHSYNGQAIDYDVKDGKIIRGRPVHYEGPDLEALTINARGKSWTLPIKSPLSAHYMAYRKRLESPNRCLYPLQRVDWEPGGDPAKINAQNRGISKYKRISWDEATTIIGSELTRVADKYGPEAICSLWNAPTTDRNTVMGGTSVNTPFLNYWLTSKYGRPHSDFHGWDTSSCGGREGAKWCWGWIYEPYTPSEHQDIADNTEMILVWPGDIETNFWHTGTIGGRMQRWFKDLGIKFVQLTNDLNRGGNRYADTWIPVLPSADAAVFLAIAYTWITEDTYEKDYVETHTVGFDLWKAYVMGDEDGIPKTPEWAAPQCGVPEWTIKALAREWASKVTTIEYGLGAGGVARSPYGHEPQRMQLYLLAMQGWGMPGRHLFRNHGSSFGTAKVSVTTSPAKAESHMNEALWDDLGVRYGWADRDRQRVPRDLLEKCILNPPVEYWAYEDPFFKRSYPMEGQSEIHLMWGGGASWSGSSCEGFKKYEAHCSPKLECIITQGMWLEDGSIWADLVLPVSNMGEKHDIYSRSRPDCIHTFFVMNKVIEPKGESKSDFEIICMIADKVGFLDEITEGKGYAVTEEWIKAGWENSAWKELASWEEVSEKGYFAQSLDPEQYKIPSAAEIWYNDPAGNPLPTPTGLFEFESQGLKEGAPDDKERPPLAHWIKGGPASEGWLHDEAYTSERAKSYPLMMVSGTHTFGYHTQHSDIPWTREIERVEGWDGYSYIPLWIHPEDAAARGIENGDIVSFYNERGSVLAVAFVTEREIPGAVYIDQGGGGDCIIPGKVNRGGNSNNIAPSIISTRALHRCHSGYLVEVEKVTGNQMDEWRKNYPEAFSRDYDPQYGPLFSGWVEGGM